MEDLHSFEIFSIILSVFFRFVNSQEFSVFTMLLRLFLLQISLFNCLIVFFFARNWKKQKLGFVYPFSIAYQKLTLVWICLSNLWILKVNYCWICSWLGFSEYFWLCWSCGDGSNYISSGFIDFRCWWCCCPVCYSVFSSIYYWIVTCHCWRANLALY